MRGTGTGGRYRCREGQTFANKAFLLWGADARLMGGRVQNLALVTNHEALEEAERIVENVKTVPSTSASHYKDTVQSTESFVVRTDVTIFEALRFNEQQTNPHT